MVAQEDGVVQSVHRTDCTPMMVSLKDDVFSHEFKVFSHKND